jgi:two-component system NtrC family sensor kinase
MSNSGPTAHLQSKVSLTLVLLFTAFVIASYSILQAVIAPAFDKLEISAAKSDLHRAEAVLLTDIENLQAVTGDWAPWDDIHDYVRGLSPGFQKSNLDRSTLENLGLDVMGVYATDSRSVWGMARVADQEMAIDKLNVFASGHAQFSALTEHANDSDQTLGIVDTNYGPLIVSSRPILRTDDSGPIAGALVMGQFLDTARLDRLRERTGVDMYWIEADADSSSNRHASYKTEQHFVAGQRLLLDIADQPILLMKTRTSRDISSLGSQTMKAATGFLIGSGVLVCAFIWVMLRQTILRPIEQLTTHIDTIRKSGDLTRKISMRRDDEIGALADQFDDMTGEVNDARQALLDQSFNAGKADTAAEVLHNIRNAMTPMINGIDRIRKSFSVTDNLRVEEALKQLTDPECEPQRKAKFVQYIGASFDHIGTVGKNSLEELKVVSSQAKQVEGILSDQERFSNVVPVAEALDLDEIIDEAKNVIPVEEQDKVEVIVMADLEQQRVRAHRIGLLQVMSNLILNAVESIRRQGTAGGQISLAAVTETVDERPMVRVTVTDNGSGFDHAMKEKMFRRGFTSKKKSKFAGLGLHWCANAVAGMGGRLSAESAGEGRGAEFHVLLPAARGT